MDDNISLQSSETIINLVDNAEHSNLDQEQASEDICLPIDDCTITLEGKIILHQLRLSREDKPIVIMMPEINKVLKSIFQIMSQANYYLQKLDIVAKRFSSDELMNAKIMGLIKNDVKVCSYITLEQAKNLLSYFEKHESVRKTGNYEFSSCVFEQPRNPLAKDAKSTIISNINLCSTEINGKEFIPLQDFSELLTLQKMKELSELITSNKIDIVETTENSVNDSSPTKFILKNHALMFMNKDLESSRYSNRLINDEGKSRNIEMTTVSEISSSTKKLLINVYTLEGKLIVTLPDITNVIKIANGFNCDNSGIHGSTLRQVNYYLAKLKCMKRKLNFHQMQSIKQLGTYIGNATYCSYVTLQDAKNLVDIFKRLPLKHASSLNNITWREPIDIDLYPILTNLKNYRCCKSSMEENLRLSHKKSDCDHVGVSNDCHSKDISKSKMDDILRILYQQNNFRNRSMIGQSTQKLEHNQNLQDKAIYNPVRNLEIDSENKKKQELFLDLSEVFSEEYGSQRGNTTEYNRNNQLETGKICQNSNERQEPEFDDKPITVTFKFNKKDFINMKKMLESIITYLNNIN